MSLHFAAFTFHISFFNAPVSPITNIFIQLSPLSLIPFLLPSHYLRLISFALLYLFIIDKFISLDQKPSSPSHFPLFYLPMHLPCIRHSLLLLLNFFHLYISFFKLCNQFSTSSQNPFVLTYYIPFFLFSLYRSFQIFQRSYFLPCFFLEFLPLIFYFLVNYFS